MHTAVDYALHYLLSARVRALQAFRPATKRATACASASQSQFPEPDVSGNGGAAFGPPAWLRRKSPECYHKYVRTPECVRSCVPDSRLRSGRRAVRKIISSLFGNRCRIHGGQRVRCSNLRCRRAKQWPMMTGPERRKRAHTVDAIWFGYEEGMWSRVVFLNPGQVGESFVGSNNKITESIKVWSKFNL